VLLGRLEEAHRHEPDWGNCSKRKNMNDSTKIALAVVGGYALGRRKKVELALLWGSALVGRRLDIRSLGKEALGRLSESPEVGQIVGDVRGELMSTGRAAAMTDSEPHPSGNAEPSRKDDRESRTPTGTDGVAAAVADPTGADSVMAKSTGAESTGANSTGANSTGGVT
jgi:hypothetical protein